MKKILLVLVLLLLDFPLRAQDAKTVDLEGSLKLSAGTESRAVVGSPNSTGAICFFSPSIIAVRNVSPLTQFSVSYIPEFDMFPEHQELNSWNHVARLGATRKFTPRFSFDAGDAFISTTDPSRQLANSFLLLPRSRYQENAFYVRGDYRLSPLTMLSFRFDNTVTRYGLAEEYREGFLDQMGNAWTASLSRRLNHAANITATYTLLDLTILDAPGQPPNAGSTITGPTHYFTVGYINSFRPDWTVGISGGFIRAADLSYALSAQVRKHLGLIWLDAEYNRTLGFFGGQTLSGPSTPQLGGGLVANDLYELVTLGASGKLGSRIGVNVRITGSRTGAGSGGKAGKSLIGTARLDYRITGYVALYAAAELYSQNLNTLPGTPTSRHLFYGGLEFSLNKRRQASATDMQTVPGPAAIQTNGDKEE